MLQEIDKLVKEYCEQAKKSDNYRYLSKGYWVITYFTKLYIRLNAIHYCDVPRKTFDIATIEIKESFRRKGIMNAIVDHVIDINPFEAVYVESVQYDWFKEYLLKKNFQQSSTNGSSYFRLTGQKAMVE